MAIVSNSSPLIAFAAIGQLSLLPAIFQSILIPPAVAAEITPSIPALPPWLHVEDLKQPLPGLVLQRSLGAGEREALALAIETRAERILLDDLPTTETLAVPVWPALVIAAVIVFSYVQIRRRGLAPLFHLFLIATPIAFLISGSSIDAQSYRYLMRSVSSSCITRASNQPITAPNARCARPCSGARSCSAIVARPESSLSPVC